MARVLVIDGDVLVRGTIHGMLEFEGHDAVVLSQATRKAAVLRFPRDRFERPRSNERNAAPDSANQALVVGIDQLRRQRRPTALGAFDRGAEPAHDEAVLPAAAAADDDKAFRQALVEVHRHLLGHQISLGSHEIASKMGGPVVSK
jgi:hypothetical protein